MANDLQSSKGQTAIAKTAVAFDRPLNLACGFELTTHELVFETYGKLNSSHTNAILICHALSGDHHAAGVDSEGKSGWWEHYIGPGKPIDTNRFFVVCPNNIGSCFGSTGPNSINPATGKHWGADFPTLEVSDWVESQVFLMEHLEIDCWAAVVGGSLGGMQAMHWSVVHPEKLQHAVVIAASLRLSAQNIAFNEVARQSIITDPDFQKGNFYTKKNKPKRGLRVARMLGHITYLSNDAMKSKFGRKKKNKDFQYDFNTEFEIESYLNYQGDKFAKEFDANTYIRMTKALDYYDPTKQNKKKLSGVFKKIKSKFLVISFTSDWRFSPSRSKEIVKSLLDNNINVSYAEISAESGHDAFLMSDDHYHEILNSFFKNILKPK